MPAGGRQRQVGHQGRPPRRDPDPHRRRPRPQGPPARSSIHRRAAADAGAKLKLNLHVLFAAKFQKYDEALRSLSSVLTFFQSRPVFSASSYPGLDPRIERLTVELESMTFEQLNQVWAFIG